MAMSTFTRKKTPPSRTHPFILATTINNEGSANENTPPARKKKRPHKGARPPGSPRDYHNKKLRGQPRKNIPAHRKQNASTILPFYTNEVTFNGVRHLPNSVGLETISIFIMKPSNSPTQGQPNPSNIRLKVAFGPLSPHSKYFFRGLGLVLYRKQTTRKLTQSHSPRTPD